jgi:hypothetical protein
MVLCLYFAPWQAILDWEIKQKVAVPDPENLSLKATGKILLLDFPLEFEWLGVTMLTGLMTAGWFLKEYYSRLQK